MDPTLLSLLDSIPQKPPRSKLETHRELIRQLRRKGCTYRDIVRILHERVGLDVAVSTIHSFIKVRAKHRKQAQYELPPLEPQAPATARMNPEDCLPNCSAQGKASRAEGKTQTLSLRRKRAVETRRPRRIAMSTQRQAEYYRVIAHTRTLSPNDEMLRILEAMGILALLTRETPVAIAVERKSLQKILENSLSKAGEVEKRMAAYSSRPESRIAQLPQGIGNRFGPATYSEAAGREPATVLPAVRSAGYGQSA